ncbi:MAG: helix-turn-helix domain-containing protein [Chitinophagaceae bacterium]|nr:helix-turn-helix domain-containing protein [Chitinophagaceae bacterium]
MRPAFKAISKENCPLFRIERQETFQEFNYPWHYHPEFELTLILNRAGVRYVGNNTENYFDHDLVLLGSNLPHTWIHYDDQEQVPNAIVIFLDQHFIDWLNNDQFPNLVQLFKRAARGIKFSREVAIEIKSKLPQLFNANNLEQCIILMQILNQLAATKEFHLLSHEGFTYDPNPTNSERINAVYEYVALHYTNKITLKDVARHVSMSDANFSRYFSKTMMKSFFSFLNEYRVNRACKLLIETDRQINEICYQSGFQSIPFFYRQFKKFKNCQPKTYRDKYHRASEFS